MRKYIIVGLLVLFAAPLFAQNSLQQALPLLQKPTRTPQETQQVLTLFRTSQDPNTVFAAGASLVRIPPAKTSEPALVSQIMRQDDPLKSAFSAVILTSMGSVYEELSPLLQDAMHTQDPVLRAYVAAAYGLINPEDATHTKDIVRLYIFDEKFAQRALNLDRPRATQYLKKMFRRCRPATACFSCCLVRFVTYSASPSTTI